MNRASVVIAWGLTLAASVAASTFLRLRECQGGFLFCLTGPSPYPDNPDVVIFFGNFYNLSHVFNIHTDEAEVIDKLAKAIRKNKRRADYLSQPKPVK